MLANPDWVDAGDVTADEIVAVDPNEPEAANVLSIGDAVIMPSQYPRTGDRLRKLGRRVVPVDVSELIKAEAGVTCCSLLFEQTQQA